MTRTKLLIILQEETDGFKERSRLRDDVLDAMEQAYIKGKKEQLTLTDVGKGTELLPDFLYKDDYGIKIGYHGDTEVSKEWNEYLEKIR